MVSGTCALLKWFMSTFDGGEKGSGPTGNKSGRTYEARFWVSQDKILVLVAQAEDEDLIKGEMIVEE